MATEESAVEPNDGPVHILVVEDTQDDAYMTTRALRRLNPPPVVSVVSDGAEAIETLIGPTALAANLVFLDLKLPKLNGLEVLEILRNTPETAQLPIVILTSSDDPVDISRAKALGASEYVRKPMDWLEYVEVVNRVAIAHTSAKRQEA